MNKNDLPLKYRFVHGKLLKSSGQQKGIAHFELIDFRSGHQARVNIKELPDGFAHEFKNRILPLFLIGPVKSHHTLWHASLEWGEETNNPWCHSQPKKSEIVVGRIIRYVDDLGAIVKLNSGLETFIHREGFPGINKAKDIAEIVFLGDTIKAEVDEVRVSRLRISLSVQTLFEKKEKELKNKRHLKPSTQKAFLKPYSETDVSAATQKSLENYQILIVDNNLIFASDLARSLDMFGAKTVVCSKPGQVKERLKTDVFTHAFLDFNLDNPLYHREIAQMLDQKNISTCIISGDTKYIDSHYLRENKFQFCQKPLTYDKMITWIEKGEGENFDQFGQIEKIHRVWKRSAHPGTISKKIERRIQTVCDKYGFDAALFVEKQRERVFRVICSHGLNSDILLREVKNFNQSFVAIAFAENKEMLFSAGVSKPLKLISPEDSKFVWLKPIQKDRSILVFFLKQENPSSSLKEQIMIEKDVFSCMMDNLAMAEHIEETESFAAKGRVISSVAHELRLGVQDQLLPIQNLDLAIKKQVVSDIEQVIPELETILKRSKQLEAISRLHLGSIQKEQKEILNIQNTIANIIQLLQLKAPDNVLIQTVSLPSEDIRINIQPAVLEQPFLNVLDNALHALKLQGGGNIDIQLVVDSSDLQTPIHIFVSDNGLGVTREEKELIFNPRTTSKGEKGFGMGLYLSRNLLESVGGKLEIHESIRWFGTTFVIKLPLTLNSL